MFKVVEVDGFIRSQIDTKGKPNKYGDPKLFVTKKDAQKWIDKHSYAGMSWKYEIVNCDESCRVNKVVNKILEGVPVSQVLSEDIEDDTWKRDARRRSEKVNYEIAMEMLKSLSPSKKDQLDKMLSRNAALTSSYTCSAGALRVYKQGWYLTLNATRSAFSVWMYDNDGEFVEARKPVESKLDFLYEQDLTFNMMGESDWGKLVK